MRALGARGGRVAAIVILLALGIAGVAAVTGARLLSGVVPAGTPVLTKGTGDPRWLILLPPLCLLWVNTHGSIFARALRPRRRAGVVAHPRTVRAAGRRHAGSHRTRVVGPRVAGERGWPRASRRTGRACWSTTSPWPGTARSPGTSPSGARPISIRPVTLLILLRPAGRPGGLLSGRGASRSLEASLGLLLFVEALRTERFVVYLLIVAAGMAQPRLPARAAWGARARRCGGSGMPDCPGHRLLAIPAVPAGAVASSAARRRLEVTSAGIRADLHGVAPGAITRVARPAGDLVDGRTDLFEGRCSAKSWRSRT